jgi:hypothetical protein
MITIIPAMLKNIKVNPDTTLVINDVFLTGSLLNGVSFAGLILFTPCEKYTKPCAYFCYVRMVFKA